MENLPDSSPTSDKKVWKGDTQKDLITMLKQTQMSLREQADTLQTDAHKLLSLRAPLLERVRELDFVCSLVQKIETPL